ncbi:3-dehydroquinate synthase [Flavobacterium solisilvae]|uniref:3-dehydroquinate synthase n=1 Tax=Flavobacterium solisilvae TaxID=1852019 RepID=A0ABX1QP98_9FLAO|nr:3-dehydroquinate synthase [Flavobacterium solisilvae]NMH24032.1 3-dehydroquinate synthase [Flavobacterium solisilvae]
MQHIEANGYSVFFNEKGYTSLNHFISQRNYSNIFIISDTNSNENCLPKFLSLLETDKNNEIIEIEPGETEKNITTCVEIWSILTELGADRKSLLINIGGGVITDIGGFIASTFKRGIDFINIPTTLLAMVDASIGGKNGVDLGNLKNQIGVINVPKMVIIDTDFLSTLPQNEMRSGLAEMLKHGLIFDEKYWNEFKDLNQKDFADFDQLIHRSVEIKNEIVMQDPTENGIRKALNFGHTLGHAIESYFLENESKKTLLHGEAIAIGMILESFLSYEKELISREEYQEIKYVLKEIYPFIEFDKNDIEQIIKLLSFDKKNEYGKILFVLLDKIGNIKINQQINNESIFKAFEDYHL